MSQFDQNDIPELKKNLVRCKKNLTRTINSTGRQTEFATRHPSEIAISEIQSCTERLKKAYAEIIDVLDALQTVSDNDKELQTYEEQKEENTLRYDEITERVMATIAEIRTPQNTPNAAPNPAPGHQDNNRQQMPKIFDSLKPHKLTEDNTPVEFRAWKEQWTSFFNASRLDLLAKEDQLQYFKVCIDTDLYDIISSAIDRNTPIFGHGGCLEILSNEFNEIYPLATRRTNYFRLTQEKDAPFSNFARQLKRMGNEADLADLQVEDLHAFRYITGCQDKKLRTKFLEVDAPSLAEFDRIVRAYERGQATSKNLDEKEEKGRINQIKKETPRKPDKKCIGCGGKWHDKRANCPNFNTTCTFCHKKGHSESVCIGKKKSSQQAPKHDSSTPAQQTKSKVKVAKNDEISETDSSSDEDEEQHGAVARPMKTKMYRVSNISTKRQHCKDTPRLKIKFTSKTTNFTYRTLQDTGATRSIISKDIADQHNLKIKPADIRLFAADDSELRCEGYTNIKAESTKIKPIVSSSLKNEIIISYVDQVLLGILPINYPCLPQDAKTNKITNNSHEEDINELNKKFHDVLSDTLPDTPMEGQKMKITIDPSTNPKPKKVYAARPVPLHYEEEAKQLINNLVKEGIIEAVYEDTCEWISPAFFVPKQSGKLRLVTDFTHLNRFIRRPVHPFPSANDIMQRIPSTSTIFAKLDAVQGYHQVELDEDSRHLTTFLLPWGKYRYRRGPMGLKSTSDIFCAKSDRAIENIKDTQKIVDDILICAPTKDILLQRINDVLTKCREMKITISKKKLAIGEQIDFAGFSISQAGIKPDANKIKALTDFPPPKNIHELRSFLGLANQLGGFIDNLASTTDPLRQLLKKGTAYKWTTDLQKAFDETLAILASPSVVNFYDPTLPTTLLSDASNLHGLGFALVQTTPEGKTQLIQCGSRSLTDAESRYAPVELECLGILWATEKCRHYLLGNPHYTVITDHNPLLGVFKRDIPNVDNKRLQRFRERLQPYNFTLEWTEGKKHLIADAFSRKPTEKPEPHQHKLASVAGFPTSARTIMLDAAAKDADYLELVACIKQHKNVHDLPPDHPARPLATRWHELSLSVCDQFVIVNAATILVPRSAQREIMNLFHQGHCGYTRTKQLIQEYFFWPHMANDIKNLVNGCQQCQALQPSQQQQPMQKSNNAHPMHRIGADLFQYAGKHYLVMVDGYSGFPFVEHLKSLSTKAIIKAMRTWFRDFGYPLFIRTDGGPQFRSEFNNFCKEIGAVKETSSPYYAQSNGLAEAAVKQTKRLLIKHSGNLEDFRNALLVWRNTPKASNYSPAQMMFGYTQNFGQGHPLGIKYINQTDAANAKNKITLDKEKSYNKRTKDLDPLPVGTKILLQDRKTGHWNQEGIITAMRPDMRSYEISSDDRITIRNRRDIKPYRSTFQ